MFAIALDRSSVAALIEERRRLDLDRRDEMWEGVLHMVPPPSFEHDSFVASLSAAFLAIVSRHDLGRVGNAGIREPGSDRNYRVPDLIFIAKNGITRFAAGSDVWIEHGPDLVVEVLSPGDESLVKLPFYAARGIPETLVVDRDTRRPQVFRLVGDAYFAAAPDAEGGHALECLRARLFYEAEPGGGRGTLALRDDRTGEVVPVR